MIKFLLISLRPKHWIKNLFIFIPALFAGLLAQKVCFFQTSLCFIYFCILSSAVYIINDIMDRRDDKAHPLKTQRPIAQGKISALFASIISSLLIISVGVGMFFLGNKALMLVALFYIALNIAYSAVLKHEAILDAISIALGFELRIWAGAVVVFIIPSAWLQVCTFLLALFFGFAKRRSEILLLQAEAAEHRKVLAKYSVLFLDQLISISAGIVILTYVLYTLSWDVLHRLRGNLVIYTTPLVVYGIFRYLYLMHMHKKGGDPAEVVLSDGSLIITVLLWVGAIFLILYL